jgi:hypothetical protein
MVTIRSPILPFGLSVFLLAGARFFFAAPVFFEAADFPVAAFLEEEADCFDAGFFLDGADFLGAIRSLFKISRAQYSAPLTA